MYRNCVRFSSYLNFQKTSRVGKSTWNVTSCMIFVREEPHFKLWIDHFSSQITIFAIGITKIETLLARKARREFRKSRCTALLMLRVSSQSRNVENWKLRRIEPHCVNRCWATNDLDPLNSALQLPILYTMLQKRRERTRLTKIDLEFVRWDLASYLQ